MYRNLKIAVVIPAYNEERLITKTIETLPSFIDYIVPVNDGSKDDTLKVLRALEKKHKKILVIDNGVNRGLGYSLREAYKHILKKTDATTIGVVSGDAQCDPNSIQPMLDVFIERSCDYVKGNRFFHRAELKAMPRYRRIGNIFITLLTKFSTGYYSISDTQMGFGFFKREILERMELDLIRDRYDYENSVLVALSIAGARIRDVPVPAIYGEAISTINFWPTAFRALRAIWVGFWQRIYYKYVFFSFHPIALFLFGGILLSLVGWVFAIFIFFEKIMHGTSPSTGTTMLAVLPIILGLQLLLTSIMMDMSNEDRP